MHGAVAGCDRAPAPSADHPSPPATAPRPVQNGQNAPNDREGAELAVARARQLFAAGDFSAARSATEEAVAKDPESAQAHFWLGRAAVVTSKATSYSLAITAFERALALDPALIEAHFGLGLAHMGYAHGEVAGRELATFLAGATDEQPPQMRGEAEHLLGVLARERGAIDEALEHFARAQELHPKFAEPAFERGVTLEGQERIDEAEAAYRAAIALDPGHLPSHFRLARLLRHLGRDADAAREERIHRLLNELTDDQTGRTTRAPERRAQLWGELALLDPGNVHARIEYVRALAELRRDAEAKLALEELLRAAPQLTAEDLPPSLRAMMPKR